MRSRHLVSPFDLPTFFVLATRVARERDPTPPCAWKRVPAILRRHADTRHPDTSLPTPDAQERIPPPIRSISPVQRRGEENGNGKKRCSDKNADQTSDD
jgi:hypothetical protein